ncbi:hypothetical protein BUL40_09885 [Croceivirga radicis]|uniref:Uncharacterized protein n=1 Tax=Croceivirga radicis TaxID=1929488 RepID=A0A1V6LQP3_9FLAO|nr:hypothetical protein [Croceivirga radicis]OQD42429.1 hypothetical protein BUL40_09885 [Croceivirga radicis]
MLKNPVIRDGLKALAIFLLPFLSYLHVYSSQIYHESRLISTLFFNYGDSLHFNVWVYSNLIEIQIIISLIIWLYNCNGKIRLGIKIILIWILISEIKLLLNLNDYNSAIVKFLGVFLTVFYFSKDGLLALNSKNYFNLILIALPILNLLTFLVPENLSQLDLVIFTISSYGYNDVGIFLNMIVFKFNLLIIYSIWFLTEKRWWRYAILSPILLIGNQIYNILFVESDTVDEIELYQSGPFLLTLLIVLLLLAKVADDQEKIKKFLQNQYKNIEQMVENRFSKKQQAIEDHRKSVNNKKALNNDELIALREKLENELRK